MKIMIICSNYTGGGHVSVYEAIRQQLDKRSDIEYIYLEGFTLNRSYFIKIAKFYGVVSRKARFMHNLFYMFCQHFSVVTKVTSVLMRKKLFTQIDSYKPDVILSLHPGFNSNVIDCLGKYGLNIPHTIVISDLVTISRMWVDKRSDIIFCPTKESVEACEKLGIAKEQLRCVGLPVRNEFYQDIPARELHSDTTIRFLLISGAEGVGKLDYILMELLKNYNCEVTVIAGRNKRLISKLEKSLTVEYKSRVNLMGYINNMPEVMSQTDIIITRSSPNLMFEAIAMHKPFVAFSKPLYQERGNAELINKNELGLICNCEEKVTACVNSLIDSDFELYNKIRKNQSEYLGVDSTEMIVDELLKLASMQDE